MFLARVNRATCVLLRTFVGLWVFNLNKMTRQTFWKRVLPLWMATLVACTPRQAEQVSSALPEMFPDYGGATVPPNIAPLNFGVEGAQHVRADFSSGSTVLFSVEGKDEINVTPDRWRRALEQCRGGRLEVTVSVWDEAHPQGVRHAPFTVFVSDDAIDPWLAYRLIPPGYRQWKRMGIYQRSLESFDERVIVDNRHDESRCVNCHSFCDYSPRDFLFHRRGEGVNTVLVREGKPRTLAPETLPQGRKGTYPHWHPGGRFVVFSSNNTVQAFYAHSRDKVEVYDLASDLFIYDVQEHRVLTDRRFTDSLYWETFPAFGPQGDALFLCRARPVLMPVGYDSLKYALLRVPFDASTGRLGEPIDTLYAPSRQGGSASFPRVSPDGRFLMYTEAACATFPIWHKEADLRMTDLHTGKPVDTSVLNSDDVESYHAWSSNGRWVVFSSRRLDGRHTRLFLAHVDAEGRFGRPFLLPQRRMAEHRLRLVSYNIPEFIRGEVKLSQRDIESLPAH